jgi:hypothetical protein
MEELSLYVPDTIWNRNCAKECIGRHFTPGRQPSYAGVREGLFPPVEYLETQLDVITAVAVSKLTAGIEAIKRIGR